MLFFNLSMKCIDIIGIKTFLLGFILLHRNYIEQRILLAPRIIIYNNKTNLLQRFEQIHYEKNIMNKFDYKTKAKSIC